MTFEVHGPGPTRIARINNVEEAIAVACSRIYASSRARDEMRVKLEGGNKASLVYGFSEVTVYVK